MKLETFFEKFDTFADAPDAVAKMRELVLELAVRGQLFPSAHADSTGSSAPFPLPGDWNWSRIGKVSDACGQKTPDTPFTYIDVGAIDNIRGLIKSDIEVVAPENAPSRARKLVRPGTVIYATVRPYLRNIAIIDREFSPPAIVSTAFAILHPKPFLDVQFLFYWLRSNSFENEVAERMKGVAYPAINDREFRACPFPLPPLAEQKRIVAKVDELMALCDRLEAQQQEREEQASKLAHASLARFADAPTPANLEYLFHSSFSIHPSDLRKSILTLAVQGKLVPQDPKDEPAEELIVRLARELTQKQRRKQAAPLTPLPVESLQYEVPDSWTWARFRDVAIIASNLVKPHDFLDFTHLAPDNIEKGNGVLLPCRTVREDKVISSNHRFYPGQIVYSKIRPNLAKVVVVDFEGLCSADMYPIDALIDAFYLQLYMLSESFLVQAVKTDTRVAMPKINQTELNMIAIPIPPLAEQRRIVAKVSELMVLVGALETHLAASRATAANLLSALVAELTSTA
jgi:type I restriction enzyme, S subunit